MAQPLRIRMGRVNNRVSSGPRPTAIGKFVFRGEPGYWRGQSDQQLVQTLKTRLTDEPISELGLEQLGHRPLSQLERELFAFLESPEGQRVVLRSHANLGPEGNRGGWVLKDGVYVVDFGLDKNDKRDRHVGPRSRYQVMLHELSHTMDGVTDATLRAARAQTNHVRNYAVDSYRRPAHQLLYQEFRANLFAYNGNFAEAWAVTQQSYSPGFIIPEGVDPASLSPEQLYRVAEGLTRRAPKRNVVVTPQLLNELLRPSPRNESRRPTIGA
jgi:hypothetical protein